MKSLVLGTERVNSHSTKIDEELCHYRQRKAVLNATSCANHDLHDLHELKVKGLTAMVASSAERGVFSLDELGGLVARLREAFGGEWLVQKVCLCSTVDALVLSGKYKSLSPAFVFQQVGERYQVRSLQYDYAGAKPVFINTVCFPRAGR